MLPSERKRLVARKRGLRVTFSKSPPEIRKFRVEHFVEGRTRRLMNKPRSPAPAVPVVRAETGQNLPPERWLMDTASPFDLTGAADMSKASKKDITPASDPAMLHTANGPTLADQVLPLRSPRLGENVEPFVLDDSPDVLSVGVRVMLKGYGWYWPPTRFRI